MEDEEEYEHSLSEFYYPDEEQISERNEETSAQPSSWSQEEMEGFINNQKSVNTTKKATTDMNTLFRYMKSIGINNDLVIHRQVKTNDIISRRFGDFMTPFSRVK